TIKRRVKAPRALLARGGDRRYFRSFFACSLRLAAQDVALSRRKQGFESPRERNDFRELRKICSARVCVYPTFIQRTLLPKIDSRSPCDVHSRRPEENGAVSAELGIGAYFLKMTHARIAARTAEQIVRPL